MTFSFSPRRPLAHLVGLSLVAAIASVSGACSQADEPVAPPGASSGADGEDGESYASGVDDLSALAAVPSLSAPDLLIQDRVTLDELEADGLDLGSVLGLGKPERSAQLLLASPLFAPVAETIRDDLAELRKTDSSAGVGLAFGHRLFDATWLSSRAVSFTLVAVTNRLDHDYATPGKCGETRLIYRLGYTSPRGSSRLPMTLAVHFENERTDGSCRDTATRWHDRKGDPRASSYRAGVLGNVGKGAIPSAIEVNLQSVRWPAAVRPDMGGHAEYLLRAFRIADGRAVPSVLENTPRAGLTKAERDSLAAFVVANIDAIDKGTVVVPDAFLTKRAVSASPRGLARGQNRPWFQLFGDDTPAFQALDYASLERIKSPKALVRRLDEATCQGCHQSRSLAGFHVLGQDADGTPKTNSIEVGVSPHLSGELPFRRALLDAAATGAADVAPTSAVRPTRPFPEHGADVAGTYGAHCGLGDPGFAAWTCAAGFVCGDLNAEDVGVCVRDGVAQAGEACETSRVTFSENPRSDAIADMKVGTCALPDGGEGTCSRSRASGTIGGFPNGACAGNCSPMGHGEGDAICGATPPSGFNECLGRGESFDACLAKAQPALRRRCDAENACGDDYVCASVPGAPKGVGACMPPYFIFQARVDGHKVPLFSRRARGLRRSRRQGLAADAGRSTSRSGRGAA